MDFYFNEQSALQKAENAYIANLWISNLLLTLKKFREYGLRFIRVEDNFYKTEIMDGYTLFNWLESSKDRILKGIFLTFVKSPYIEDEEDYSFERYINENYFLEENCITCVSGLAIAY